MKKFKQISLIVLFFAAWFGVVAGAGLYGDIARHERAAQHQQ